MSENINPFNFQIMTKYNDQGAILSAELHTPFPNFCPNCDFTHDTKLWVYVQGVFCCDSCNYILQEKDLWHSELET